VIPLPSQFNTLVQGLSIASITPQQILAAGEPIFLDIRTSSDINSINTLIQSYARIHAPTYGQPIPLTGIVSSVTGIGTILHPGTNEIRKVLACTVANSGGAPIIGTITLGGLVIATFNALPTATTIVPLTDIFCSKGLAMNAAVSEGDASNLTTSCASILVVQ